MAEISQNCCQGEQHEAEMTLLAYYMAAVRVREHEHMPLTGPSVDRRTLAMVHKLVAMPLCREWFVAYVLLSTHTCGVLGSHVETSSVCGHA